MSDWRTVGVRLKEEDVGQLNQRLKQLGYGSLNEFVGGITAGVVTNKQVVEELAEAIADKIVNKLLTSNPPPESIRTDSQRGQAGWAGSSVVECLPRTQERAPARRLPEAGGSSPPQSTKSSPQTVPSYGSLFLRKKGKARQRNLQISGMPLLCSEA
jgi:hypothetical protein